MMMMRRLRFCIVPATVLLLCLQAPERARAQIFGEYACDDGNFCGPSYSPDYCTAEQNTAAYNAFLGYFGNILDSSDSYGASMAYTTGDGNGDDIPAFEFRWHGPSSLVPIAGTYVGRNALAQFFGLVFDPTNGVTDFSFNTAFAPNTYGVRVPAYNCQFAIAQWQEMYIVTSSGKTVSYGDNTVVYTFLNASYPYIVSADVWVDGGQYQDAFCPGQINCNDYNTVVVQNCSADTLANAVAVSSSSSEDSTFALLVLVVIMGLVNFVLLIVLLAGFFGCKEKASLGSRDYNQSQLEMKSIAAE